MKIRINKNGYLSIKRAGVFKNQWCCRQPMTTEEAIKCGDWCPLFGEPVTIKDRTGRIVEHQLTICGGTVLGGNITDNREAKPETPVE